MKLRVPMCPSYVRKMPRGNYKSFIETPCRRVCPLGQWVYCMWIFLRSIIRGGWAGRGGCGPCRHKLKNIKAKGRGEEGKRGRVSGGNWTAVVPRLWVVLSWGSTDGYRGISAQRSLTAPHKSPCSASSLVSQHIMSLSTTIEAEDLGCGFFVVIVSFQ